MVKGISRQVIVVHPTEQKLFDQAIFILNDEAVGKEGITDQMLLKAAEKLLHTGGNKKNRSVFRYGALWACAGALATGVVWLLTVLI